MKKHEIIPDFKNEDEEREFWATHSPLDYFDTKQFKKASFPKLKPSVKLISIRLPEDMLAELKTLANKKEVPRCFEWVTLNLLTARMIFRFSL